MPFGSVTEALDLLRTAIVQRGRDSSFLEELASALGIVTPEDNEARLKRAAESNIRIDLSGEDGAGEAESPVSPAAKKQNRGSGDSGELPGPMPNILPHTAPMDVEPGSVHPLFVSREAVDNNMG